MRAALGFLTGMAVALVGLAALHLSPAVERLFPTIQLAVPASLAVAGLGALWIRIGPPADATGSRAAEWRRAALVWFPVGVAIGCVAAVLALIVLIAIFIEI